MTLDVSYFKVFGCKAYIHTHKDTRINKLQPKTTVMIFVRYELGIKGYRIWNPTTQSIVVARDATFDENSFPRQEFRPIQSEPVEAYPPVQPEPTSDNSDPELFFPEDISSDQLPRLHIPDKHEQDDDDDNLYVNPDPPPQQQLADPNESRFVMSPSPSLQPPKYDPPKGPPVRKPPTNPAEHN